MDVDTLVPSALICAFAAGYARDTCWAPCCGDDDQETRRRRWERHAVAAGARCPMTWYVVVPMG